MVAEEAQELHESPRLGESVEFGVVFELRSCSQELLDPREGHNTPRGGGELLLELLRIAAQALQLLRALAAPRHQLVVDIDVCGGSWDCQYLSYWVALAFLVLHIGPL